MIILGLINIVGTVIFVECLVVNFFLVSFKLLFVLKLYEINRPITYLKIKVS